MSTRKRQVFSSEFKREAVALLEKGDKNVAQLARELGVKRTHLHRWKEELDTYGSDAFPGVGKRNKQTSNDETARLRAENRRLQEENEILKKAAVGSIDQRNRYPLIFICCGLSNETNLLKRREKYCF